MDHNSPWGPPKNWITPYLLLMLKTWQGHGYEMMQRLAALGFAAIDQSYLYRTLRQLEKDGLVTSTWETVATGPARRLYSLTEAGEAFLKESAQAMEAYRGMLEGFFKLYGLHVQPAVNVDGGAGDVPAVDRQEADSPGDLVGPAEPAKGNTLED